MESHERSVGNRYLIVAITLILIFAGMGYLSIQLDREIVRAEKAQFDLRVSELRAAVLLMEASAVAKSRKESAKAFIGSNPLSIIDTDEMNYAGNQYLAQLNEKEKQDLIGMWFFEPVDKVVIYLPRSEALLKSLGIAERKRPQLMVAGLQFKVVGLWSDVGQQKKLKGLRLEALYK